MSEMSTTWTRPVLTEPPWSDFVTGVADGVRDGMTVVEFSHLVTEQLRKLWKALPHRVRYWPDPGTAIKGLSCYEGDDATTETIGKGTDCVVTPRYEADWLIGLRDKQDFLESVGPALLTGAAKDLYCHSWTCADDIAALMRPEFTIVRPPGESRDTFYIWQNFIKAIAKGSGLLPEPTIQGD